MISDFSVQTWESKQTTLAMIWVQKIKISNLRSRDMKKLANLRRELRRGRE